MMLCFRTVGTLADNSLLLIHGTEDRVVPLSQSWLLSQALVQEGVLFKQMIYPNASHDLYSVRDHFQQTLEKYFLQVKFGTFYKQFSICSLKMAWQLE